MRLGWMMPGEGELGYPNSVFRKAGIVIVAVLLGAGAALGVGGCGDQRGSVRFEGDTGGTGTVGTTAPTTATTAP